jgi:hypothetical protein
VQLRSKAAEVRWEGESLFCKRTRREREKRKREGRRGKKNREKRRGRQMSRLLVASASGVGEP